jgi:hypothetical protein
VQEIQGVDSAWILTDKKGSPPVGIKMGGYCTRDKFLRGLEGTQVFIASFTRPERSASLHFVYSCVRAVKIVKFKAADSGISRLSV